MWCRYACNATVLNRQGKAAGVSTTILTAKRMTVHARVHGACHDVFNYF